MESKLLETIGIDPHQYEIQSFKSQLYNVYAWKEW